jgi:hypothetical protein
MTTFVVVDAEPGTPCKGRRRAPAASQGGLPCSNDAEWIVQIPTTPLTAYACCSRHLHVFKADIEKIAGEAVRLRALFDETHDR